MGGWVGIYCSVCSVNFKENGMWSKTVRWHLRKKNGEGIGASWLDIHTHLILEINSIPTSSSVSDFFILFSYSFRLLKPAIGWFLTNLSCSCYWVMGMKMIMVMINIWDHGLSYYYHICTKARLRHKNDTYSHFLKLISTDRLPCL